MIDAYSFLCGVVAVLIAEAVVLMLVTEWMERRMNPEPTKEVE